MKPNYTKQAIDILAMENLNHESLLLKILKIRPSVIVKAYENTAQIMPEWLKEVIKELKAGYKIRAIKLYRQETGMGIKEAKEACDRIDLWN